MKVKSTMILSPRGSHCYYFSMVSPGPYCMHTLTNHNMYLSILTHPRLFTLVQPVSNALPFFLPSSPAQVVPSG